MFDRYECKNCGFQKSVTEKTYEYLEYPCPRCHESVFIYKSMLVTAKDEIDSLNDRIKTLESQIKACEALKDLAISELEAYVVTKNFFES